MAKTLAAFPQDDLRGGRYPWNKWLDGQVWHLERGTRAQVEIGDADYHVTTKSFRSAATQATKAENRRGRKGRVRTVVVEEVIRTGDGENDVTVSEGLIIQFIPEGAEAQSEQ
jgi:hypothetical protein